MPPFADRFAFALNTLKLMNDEPKAVDRRKFIKLFDPEIDRLQRMWDEVRKVAGVEAGDEGLWQRYSEWVKKIYDCFDPFRKTSLEKTYTSWTESQGLMDVLRSGRNAKKLPDTRPNVWAVLNAAWRVRLDCSPQELKVAIPNALRLLDANDQTLIERSEQTGRFRPDQVLAPTTTPVKPSAPELGKEIMKGSGDYYQSKKP